MALISPGLFPPPEILSRRMSSGSHVVRSLLGGSLSTSATNRHLVGGANQLKDLRDLRYYLQRSCDLLCVRRIFFDGAINAKQIENFGLPNCSEYGWQRPAGYDPGMVD